mmetsp:Transcript_24776/g.56514  ORF Transcript_24776/g.56514 Transcript_24776/m.56514 type:complete len:177 (+) Transcript_24776:160-690(+)
MAEQIADQFIEAVSSLITPVANVQNTTLYAPLTEQTGTGPICGIGVNLSLVHSPPLHVKSEHYTYITIVESIEPSSPAERAGLQVDDVIVSVNDKTVDDGQTIFLPEGLAEMIRGPEGSFVEVTVGRDDRLFKYTLRREAVSKSAAVSPRSTLRKIAMPITPDFDRRLDNFEDRLL